MCTVGYGTFRIVDASSQPRPRFDHRGLSGRASILGLRQLDLTPAQRESIRTVIQTHRAELQKLRRQSVPIRRALREATTGTAIDESVIENIKDHSNQLAETVTLSVLEVAKLRSEIFALLTPAQQDKAGKLQARRGPRMDRWRPDRREFMDRNRERRPQDWRPRRSRRPRR
ncbi:MAG: Spy/CpxP family protein refolding chaperone [Acidobacteriota bacterium]|nr:Spy/CpxP family protein refolding chaperone [Acidobacteriota bacterium]